MKIEIKKNLIVFRKLYEWEEVRDRIKADYGRTIFAISWRTRRELGFTVRNHKGLVKWAQDSDYKDDELWLEAEFKNRYHYEDQVHLDFYNEVQMSWFVLKYLNTSG
jgi:hypothetical protein